MPVDDRFMDGFDGMQKYVYEWAERKGWNEKYGERESIKKDGEDIALMHSELSEALEGMRHGNPPSDKISEFSSVEEEYADTIIRIMHHAEARNLRVASALVAKMAYNENRPYKHNKQF